MNSFFLKDYFCRTYQGVDVKTKQLKSFAAVTVQRLAGTDWRSSEVFSLHSLAFWIQVHPTIHWSHRSNFYFWQLISPSLSLSSLPFFFFNRRVTELLTQDWQLSASLRVPAISRLQVRKSFPGIRFLIQKRGDNPWTSMDPMQLSEDVVQTRQTRERMTHWDMLTKESLNLVALFIMFQCVICSSIWRVCITWSLSCKRLIHYRSLLD